jgi:acyl-CoA reductase-like NAD-dependent aldehyde dehydrogenase
MTGVSSRQSSAASDAQGEQSTRLSARDLIAIGPYIDGRALESESRTATPLFNPANGEKLAETPDGSEADVAKAVASARLSFVRGGWASAAPSAKKSCMLRWADLITASAARLDALDALEMGKPVSVRAFDAASAANFVRFNAEAIDKVQGEVMTSDPTSTFIQKRMPRGVVAAIVPWNFPTYNVLLKVAPALAAGNSVVLKPSELAAQSALLLARLASEAGIPPGVLNVVAGRGEIVGKALGEHMDVDMVTFTGSSDVGKLMLHYAGVSNMKVISAECGGKSPQIVFDDGVDLDAAADAIASMITLNQGQICSVGSRVLVQKTIEERLVEKIVQRITRIVAGDPQQTATTYGPLVSKPQMAKVMAYITGAASQGARLAHGGRRLLEETGGYFVEPTVFVNVAPTSRLAQEEIFGPVLSVLSFEDFNEAVRLANSTAYGLAAYVWTARLDTGFRIANAMPTGVTMINAHATAGEGPGHAFSAEPAGLSGVGPEGGLAGLQSYTRRQAVWFNHG